MPPGSLAQDWQLRLAAFDALRRLTNRAWNEPALEMVFWRVFGSEAMYSLPRWPAQ
jgi:hypothetical protein